MVKHQIKQVTLRSMMLFACLFSCVVLNTSILSISSSAASTISQGYSTVDKLATGSIVSLATNSADQVVPATSLNSDNILGVVINQNDSLLTLTNGSEVQVQVVTGGTVQVLVSDINGPISSGDHITSSPISGVGMKASGNVRVIGIAQGNLTNGSNQSYTDKSNIKHTVRVGTVPVLVSVSYYFKEPDKTIIPSAIQNVANSLAGRSVSTLPIVISGVIFLIMIIIVSSIIFSMVRNSIISVGRNPMSQSAIYRDLVQLSALVLVILAVGISAIYLILTRM